MSGNNHFKTIDDTFNNVSNMINMFLIVMVPLLEHVAHADPEGLSFEDNLDWVNDVSETMRKSSNKKMKLIGRIIHNMFDNVKRIIDYYDDDKCSVDIPIFPRNYKEVCLVKDNEALMRFYYLLDEVTYMYYD